MVETSPAAIAKLAEDLAKGIRTIEDLNSDLENQLNKLGTSFQDEGFENVRKYVGGTKRAVENAMPDLQTVISKLLEYADEVNNSRNLI